MHPGIPWLSNPSGDDLNGVPVPQGIAGINDPRVLPHGLPRIGTNLVTMHGYSLPPVTAMRQLPAVSPDARYFRISNNQGAPVRLSAKFAPLYYQLLSDLETQSGSARVSFQQMQEFLLSGGFIPDPANLFDVMEFKEVLENEN